MDQTAELARVKALIRALAARTVDRGCTEAEAMAAADKVGDLLAVYGLAMTEVDLREEACVERRLAPRGPGAVALRWLFPAVLRFCDCRGWTDGRATLVLFGLEPDVQMAEWLLHVLDAALATETTRYHRAPGFPRASAAAALRSFRYGFAARVTERLKALGTSRASPAPSGAGTALVVAKARKLDAALADTGVRLRTVRGRATVRDADAYRSGEAAGDRVGLDRPVEPRASRPVLRR